MNRTFPGLDGLDALIAATSLDGLAALVWGEHEVPCRHKKKRRKKDAKRGFPHGKTHTIGVPLMAAVAVDAPPATNGETLTVRWGADGVLRL